VGVREAIANAVANEDREFAETRWSDAISAGGTDPGLLGGYGGVRRGRSGLEHLRVGDTVDWWRVEAYEPDHLLRLRAEMELLGRA